MKLSGEGVDVWRPVSAMPLPDGTWVLLGPVPADEQWEFATGTVVRAPNTHSTEANVAWSLSRPCRANMAFSRTHRKLVAISC